MATAKFEHVVSYSSEDSRYPAKNLLKFGNKWLCKSPGEDHATVILQLDQPRVIQGIDIGNLHSAFIHVLVGRAASDNYETLVPTFSLMLPGECLRSTHTDRVQMFSKQHFVKATADEKWDRIKVVCTQPFNERVQYGLSFITVKCSEDEPKRESFDEFSTEQKKDTGDSTLNLGRLHPKKDGGDESVGSLSAKQKQLCDRDDAPPANGTSPKNNVGHLLKPSLSPAQQKAVAGKVAAEVAGKMTAKDLPANPKKKPNFPAQNKRPASPVPKPTVPTRPQHRVNPPSANTLISPKAQNTATNTPGKPAGKGRPAAAKAAPPSSRNKRPSPNATKNPHPAKKTRVPVKRKPFIKLLEGVTIVISGIMNPARSILRSKALDMGAKYKQDWDSTCTHLICAFKNTPKFKQVQGHGHIVTKDWIEQCHSKRKRLPWRRYALDMNDYQQPESEDEVDEEIPIASTSRSRSASPVVSNCEVDTSAGCKADSGSDTEDEFMRSERKERAPTAPSHNPYLSDTDVEDDERPDTANLPMPPLS